MPQKYAHLIEKADVEGYKAQGYDPILGSADNYQAVGYDAQGYSPVLQEDSLMRDISVDPRLKESQLGALQALREMGQGGLTLQEELDINRQKRNIAADSQREQRNIIDNLAQRGVSSGGLELAARSASAQQAANAMSDKEAQIQAESKMRALNALISGGSLAGNIRGQEFGEQSSIAQAQDAINKFKSMTSTEAAKYLSDARNKSAADLMDARNSASQYNTGANNQMALANLGYGNEAARFGAESSNKAGWMTSDAKNAANTRYTGERNAAIGNDVGAANAAELRKLNEIQRISDANTGISNMEKDKNLGQKNAVKQQTFANNMDIAKGKAGQSNNLADYFKDSAKDKVDMYGNIVQGINQGIGAGAAYAGSQPKTAATSNSVATRGQGFGLTAEEEEEIERQKRAKGYKY